MKNTVIKTIRMTQSLADRIADFSERYGIRQQDAIRLAIQRGLSHLDEFLAKKGNEE